MMSLIQNSIENLKAHKLRVGLTIFWIIVGITSIILVGSIGNGVKKQIINSTQNISNQSIEIAFQPNDDSMSEFIDFMSPINQSDILAIESISGIKKVTPYGVEDSYSFGELKINNSTTYVDLYGFDENGQDENKDKYEIIYGRKFNESDRNKNVIILNQNSAMELYEEEQKLIGKGVEINGNIYEVVGIMNATEDVDPFGFSEWNPLSYYSMIPKSTLERLITMNESSSTSYTGIKVEALKGYDISKVEETIINILKENHPNIQGNYLKQDLGYDMTEDINMMISGVNKFVLLVTGISMLVGGLGVMNIMYVSVIERKREIGIRRAIGATPFKIITQFLSEATVITLSGCFLGLIIGSIVLKYASGSMPFNAIPSTTIYIQAILSSVLTGIIAGLIPAIKASKVDPIDAIQG